MSEEKIVIIGGGFAGIEVIKRLATSKKKITLISEVNYFLFQPFLCQVATGFFSPTHIAIPLRTLLNKYQNVQIVFGEVTDINPKQKQVVVDGKNVIPYHQLVIAAGAKYNYFGQESWKALCPGLKTIADAILIHDRIFTSLEKAESMQDHEAIDNLLTFAIIGAGPTGVELAGEIARLTHKTLKKNFSHIKTNRAKIYLIDSASRILPFLPEKLVLRVQKLLENSGVDLIYGKNITKIKDGEIEIDEQIIEVNNIFWAAGICCQQFFPAETDKAGRIIVNPDLTVKGHPHIFVIGDLALACDEKHQGLPALATVAVQQGAHVAYQIKKNKTDLTFHYHKKNTLIPIMLGKGLMVTRCGRQYLGLIPWLFWFITNLVHLPGLKNRLCVIMECLTHLSYGFVPHVTKNNKKHN